MNGLVCLFGTNGLGPAGRIWVQPQYKKSMQWPKKGISFIGFDEGLVGFLLKQDGELFLVHSNYLFPNSVCLERIEQSNVFKKFSTFHLVDISNSNALLQRWLDDVEIL